MIATDADIIRAVARNPGISQRELAIYLGYKSVGALNHRCRRLTEQGYLLGDGGRSRVLRVSPNIFIDTRDRVWYTWDYDHE